MIQRRTGFVPRRACRHHRSEVAVGWIKHRCREKQRVKFHRHDDGVQRNTKKPEWSLQNGAIVLLLLLSGGSSTSWCTSTCLNTCRVLHTGPVHSGLPAAPSERGRVWSRLIPTHLQLLPSDSRKKNVNFNDQQPRETLTAEENDALKKSYLNFPKEKKKSTLQNHS